MQMFDSTEINNAKTLQKHSKNIAKPFQKHCKNIFVFSFLFLVLAYYTVKPLITNTSEEFIKCRLDKNVLKDYLKLSKYLQ